ncbi:MAG: hypothetical protein ACERKZ_09540 [Lachnotalea sp.]
MYGFDERTYCLYFESADNGQELQKLHILKNGQIEIEKYDEDLLDGLIALKVEGVRIASGKELYFEGEFKCETVKLKAIPYYSWGIGESIKCAYGCMSIEINVIRLGKGSPYFDGGSNYAELDYLDFEFVSE